MSTEKSPIEQDSHLPPEVVEHTQDIALGAQTAGAVVTAASKRKWAAEELRKLHTDEVDAAVLNAQAAGAIVDKDTRGSIASAVSHQLLHKNDGKGGKGA